MADVDVKFVVYLQYVLCAWTCAKVHMMIKTASAGHLRDILAGVAQYL